MLERGQNTHLICDEPVGEKYHGAVRWKIPVVKSGWIDACIEKGIFFNHSSIFPFTYEQKHSLALEFCLLLIYKVCLTLFLHLRHCFDWLIAWLTADWLTDWLIDCWLIGWLIDWSTADWLIDWLIDWLRIDRLIDWSIADWSIDWSIDWLIDWLIDWVANTFFSFFPRCLQGIAWTSCRFCWPRLWSRSESQRRTLRNRDPVAIGPRPLLSKEQNVSVNFCSKWKIFTNLNKKICSIPLPNDKRKSSWFILKNQH